MSPKEYPMQVWMKGYISRILSVNNLIATKATGDVLEFAERLPVFNSLNEYGAGILLPLAHALINNFKGRDSRDSFCFVSREFGIPSLEYISWLQVNGLDNTYGDMLFDVRKNEMAMHAIAEDFADERGRSIWMAYEAGCDVLYENLPIANSASGSNLKGIQAVISNARYFIENISSERFQYMSSNRKERILDEAKTIVGMKLTSK